MFAVSLFILGMTQTTLKQNSRPRVRLAASARTKVKIPRSACSRKMCGQSSNFQLCLFAVDDICLNHSFNVYKIMMFMVVHK